MKTVCNRDCPDACGIVATVEAGRVTKIAGDPDHPVTQGFLCWRTNHYLETQYAPERLTTPLLRKSGSLVPVSWDEALDFIAERLLAIRAESGPAAIFHYASGGSLGLVKKAVDLFFEELGPCTKKRGDICSGAGEAAQEADFGVSDSNDLFDLLGAKHIVIWGKNVFTSSPHTLTVLKDAKARGTELVLVDPVHQRTASICDRYVQPRPGGDFALAMAVARILFERGWTDPEASSYCDGLDEFRALAHQKTTEAWCAEADATFAEAEDIARRLANGPTAILVGWGMGRRKNGGGIVRALDALGLISGNVGIRGGGVSFYFRRRGAFDVGFVGNKPPPRTICEPLFGSEILAAKDPPVRAVWITAGNPVAMLPDSETNARALETRELVVVVDAFLTDTAQRATVVLPTTTLLEADDLLGAYGHHWLGVAQPVVPPPDGVLSDLEIVQRLAARVGLGDKLGGSARDFKRRMIKTKLEPLGVTLEKLEQGPVKNPLAPPVLFEGRTFRTPNGKARLITSPPPSGAMPQPEFPLLLASLSTPKSQSSQWARAPELPLELTVHPDAATGIESGEVCLLESAIGSIRVRLRFDDRQRRDVAILPKGGHLASGSAANAITRASLTDLGEGGALYDEPVRLRRLS
ncbi:MAG: molybdopterin-dependent oxidoreductase [Polyangiaceae bacterium]|nr:molybdopterin-dependent oxidoreductase [Polyangiaceae bacterium]